MASTVQITFDAADPGALSRFWAEALGYELDAPPPGHDSWESFLEQAGVPRERVFLDPGLGFAKQPRHNWELLAAIDVLRELGCPLLVGASRKSFLGSLLAVDGSPRPVDQREHAHVALVTVLAVRGVEVLRVHDVRATRDALAVVAALRDATPGETA